MPLRTALAHIGLKLVPYNITMCICASMLVFCFGYDNGSAGSVTAMPEFLKIMGDMSPSLHGMVVSSCLLTGVFSAFLAGVLADKYGRTRIMGFGACVDGIGVAIECAAPKLSVFIVGRLIKGLGAGLYLSTTYVQVSEMAPARIRGPMTSLPQFIIVIGVVVGYFLCYGSSKINGSLSWRLPLAIGSFAAFLVTLICMAVVPSPRWLLAHGKPEQAQKVMADLEFEDYERQEMLDQFEGQQAETKETSIKEELHQLLTEGRLSFQKPYRKPTLFGCFLMGMQSFSGIDGVLFYAPTMFKQAGLKSTQSSFLASGMSALVIFIGTIPGTIWADSWGRRTCSIVGGILQAIAMLVMGILYATGQVHDSGGAGRWVVIICVYIFSFVFSGTWALSFRTYCVESVPRKTRAGSSSLAQSTAWTTNFTVALITPIMLAASSCIAYFFFGVLTLITTIIIYYMMTETRGKSLELIEKEYMETNGHIVDKKDAVVKVHPVLESTLMTPRTQSEISAVSG